MNIAKELIEAAFMYDYEKNHLNSTLALYDYFEEAVEDGLGFSLSFYGEIPWFVVHRDPMIILVVGNDQDDVAFEVEFRIDQLGNLYQGEISNMKGMDQRFNIE